MSIKEIGHKTIGFYFKKEKGKERKMESMQSNGKHKTKLTKNYDNCN